MLTLTGHTGDVYTVNYHPQGGYIASGGYDKIVRLYDVERERITKAFTGHSLSISSAIFTPMGNLIISGSKDNSIKFWDIVSGLCVKTISSHLGEVTSVDMSSNGYYLLSSSKDNSNRLWDVRMVSIPNPSYDPLENSKAIKTHPRISFDLHLRVIHW
jgi:COMPASS component SWD3